ARRGGAKRARRGSPLHGRRRRRRARALARRRPIATPRARPRDPVHHGSRRRSRSRRLGRSDHPAHLRAPLRPPPPPRPPNSLPPPTAGLPFSGPSARPGRAGLPIAQWFFAPAQAHAKFDVGLADLKEAALPLLDEPKHPRLGQYEHAHTKAWSARVKAADAF